MIAGLDIFREHFENDTDHYILIGGSTSANQHNLPDAAIRTWAVHAMGLGPPEIHIPVPFPGSSFVF
jgi:hypothetical protein